ncbi:MAG: T9SS type A sorting domain-containing protein [Flavobacteriales bacterium]|nr:T9SS type A sorting domain-containing protein [Flavobacteriales bacterium]
MNATDDVYLSFYLQPQGLGNDPDENDNIYVDFFRATDQVWIERWSLSGGQFLPFEQFFIPLADSTGIDFFHDGFKFRFRTENTLSGNLDHWHLDYVYLDEGIDPETLEFTELALMDPESTLLQDYTAMPWSHFKANPESFMLQGNTTINERVLGSTPINFESGFRVDYEDQFWDMPNSFANTSGLGIIETLIESDDYVFPTDVNDTCAVFTVKFYHEIADGTQANDTTSYEQVFTNYYAYDDGSAEKAYALNVAGGKLAMRFRAESPDSLIGMFIHFTPFQDNNDDELFLLRAWGDNAGEPGNELAENYAFQSPNYYENGYNVFAYYEYDNPIFVDGTFYCGMVQDSESSMNFGNDKNTNSNPENLFYQLGLGGEWQQSSIQGTVMMRPVFQAGKTDVWNSIGEMEGFEFLMYPNPASNMLNIYPTDMERAYSIEVFDLTGKIVRSESNARQEYRLNVDDLTNGIYHVRLISESGSMSTHKFIKE